MNQTDEPLARDESQGRSGLFAVYTTVFLDILGFGLILPALPYYARELGASGTLLGILFAAYSVAQLFGSIVLGRLSDRWGRRPTLLLSLTGTSLAMLASAFAGTLFTLAVARFVGGLFAGSIGVGQAYIADVTSAADRPKRMGLLGAAIGAGFVLGPGLGVVAISLGWGFRGAALIAAALGGANLALAAVRLRESRQRTALPDRLGVLRLALEVPALRRVLAAMFLSTVAFVGMETTLAFFAADRFGLAERGFGLLLVLAGVVLVIIQGGGIGRLTARHGVRSVAIAGGVVLAIGLAGLALSTLLMFAMLAIIVIAAGQGLLIPTQSTLLSYGADRDHQGVILGAGRSMGAAARAVGPLAAGPLYDLDPSAPFWAGMVLSLLAAVFVAGGPKAPSTGSRQSVRAEKDHLS